MPLFLKLSDKIKREECHLNRPILLLHQNTPIRTHSKRKLETTFLINMDENSQTMYCKSHLKTHLEDCML